MAPWLPSAWHRFQPQAVSDSEGLFRLVIAEDASNDWPHQWPLLVVSAADHLSRAIMLPTAAQRGDRLGDIVLQRRDDDSVRRVRGRIVGSDGEPVVGTPVWPSRGWLIEGGDAFGRDRRVREDGLALLQRLATVHSQADGSFALALPGDCEELISMTVTGELIRLDVRDWRTPVEIVMPPAARRLRGRIVTPAGDVPESPSLVALPERFSSTIHCFDIQILLDPAASQHALARSSSGTVQGCRPATISADGRFTIEDAPEGDLRLSFAAPGWRTRLVPVSADDARGELLLSVQVAAPRSILLSADDSDWLARLSADSSSVTAWQLPFVSSAGEVADLRLVLPLELSVQRLGDELLLEIQPEFTDGGLLAVLIPGAYPLAWSLDETAADGAPLRGTLVAQPEVTGTVVDELGEPIAGVKLEPRVWYGMDRSSNADVILLRTLWLSEYRQGRMTLVFSDSEGRFGLRLREPSSPGDAGGSCFISYQHNDFLSGVITLEQLEQREEPLVMYRAATVSGRASTDDGQAAAGARITISPRTRESCRTTRWQDDGLWFESMYTGPVAEAIADSDGSYSLAGLAAGDYCLLATTPEGLRAGPNPFSIAAGETLPLDASLTLR